MVKLLVVLDLCTTAVVRTGMSCKSSIYGIKVTMLNGGGRSLWRHFGMGLQAVWRHVTKGREGVNFSLKTCDAIYGRPLYWQPSTIQDTLRLRLATDYSLRRQIDELKLAGGWLHRSYMHTTVLLFVSSTEVYIGPYNHRFSAGSGLAAQHATPSRHAISLYHLAAISETVNCRGAGPKSRKQRYSKCTQSAEVRYHLRRGGYDLIGVCLFVCVFVP